MTWALDNGYRDDLSIDRIDNDGSYELSNCRWVTQQVQTRNSRLLFASNTSGYRGVSRTGNRRSPWGAHIKISGKAIHIGSYGTAKSAAIARDAYVVARDLEHTLNFPRI